MAAISSLIALGTAAAGAYSATRQASAANRATDAQTALAQEQAALAREQWDYYRQNYQPLERQLIGDARDYDSPERREQAANTAMADQEREWNAASRNLQSRFASMGLNPTDGRFQDGLQSMSVQAAANKAGAANLARRSVEQEGWNRRLGIAALGRNIPAQVSGTMSAAMNGLGNSAALNSQMAGQNALGGAYLGKQLGDAFTKWWNKPDYTSGVWGTTGPGE